MAGTQQNNKNSVSISLSGKCLSGQAGLFKKSLTPGAWQFQVMERWQPILFRALGTWVPSRLPSWLCSAQGHLLQLSKSQMVPIFDLCQEGFPQAAWTKAMVSSRLIKLVKLSIPVPVSCSPALPNVLSPPPWQGDTSPHPALKGISRIHTPGVKRDLPGGEFSITSAW